LLGARLLGPETEVWRLVDLQASDTDLNGAVVVVGEPSEALLARLRSAKVAAVVMPESQAPTAPPREGPALWLVADPRVALARLSERLNPRPALAFAGIHASAIIDPTARLGADVAIGAGVIIAAGAELADGVVVGPGCSIGAGARIGAGSELRERVVLADGVQIGSRCLLKAGCVIGSDGYGYALGPRGAERIRHLGGVIIEDDVDIGSNSCVDRGTLLDTRIGARSKIGALVEIGHNVHIGSDTIMVGNNAVGGSTRIGDRVTVAGFAGFVDHIKVGDDARIGAGSIVTKSVPAGATWAGYPARAVARWQRELYLIGRLEEIWAFIKGKR
jgi:UDP-3-O-[3-hydroxymyristoyl] glucosamine N-acyltransferase